MDLNYCWRRVCFILVLVYDEKCGKKCIILFKVCILKKLNKCLLCYKKNKI